MMGLSDRLNHTCFLKEREREQPAHSGLSDFLPPSRSHAFPFLSANEWRKSAKFAGFTCHSRTS